MTRHLAAGASRRGLLGGVLVGVTTAGCQLDPSAEAPARRRASTPATPDEDPDTGLVRRVGEELAAALALVSGVARARRPLAAAMEPWQALHRAHLEALEAPAPTRTARVGGPVRELTARVRRQESLLQRRLADAAVTAQSGALAALLAQMSAAVAQQLAADAAEGER